MWIDLLKSALEDGFGRKLEQTISRLGLSIKEFAQESGIPESTLYKIVSGKRDFRVSTLKEIVKTVKQREELGSEFTIAIITTREALDMISRRLRIGEKELKLKEYPATTIEEEMIQGIYTGIG